jgi:hypothetical protein
MEEPTTRCAFCPHEADLNPPPPLPPNPPFTQLPCGHRLHTFCCLIRLQDVWLARITCPECNERIVGDELAAWLRNTRDRNPARPNDVTKLWENNEVFREQVREAAKLERDAAKKRSAFSKQCMLLKREWKEKTVGYRTYLENLRQTFIRRYREIPGKREKATAEGKAHRAKRAIRDSYDLGYYELEQLNRIRGAPKIGYVSRRWRRFNHPNYLFRFWL